MEQTIAFDGAEAPQPATRRWWQWFLLYPTFAGALLTTVPNIWDRAMAVYHETHTATYSEALKQTELYRRNLACAAQEYDWYNNPANIRAHNIRVYSTVCPSGDLLIRVRTPQEEDLSRWVAVEDMLRRPEEGAIIPAAHAAPMNGSLLEQIGIGRENLVGLGRTQGFQSHVICQRFIDARMILRRVQTPQGCFDEIVDSVNGAVVRRTQVACVPSC